jgi:hypothetical protein
MSGEIVESERPCGINWPGVGAGLLVIALPFLGTWWKLILGTDAVIVTTSPFGVYMSIFGEPIYSPLIWWLGLAFQLCVLYIGLLLLIGSLLAGTHRYAAIAKLLVRFSARKLLWLLVAFVAALFGFILLANQLTELAGLPFTVHLPYLVGRSTFTAAVDGLHVTIPIFMGFTRAFAVAVLAAALGILARLYQRRQSEKAFMRRKPLT